MTNSRNESDLMDLKGSTCLLRQGDSGTPGVFWILTKLFVQPDMSSAELLETVRIQDIDMSQFDPFSGGIFERILAS